MKDGKREGAGRPPLGESIKKKGISIKLPPWLITWMDSQTKSRPELIEEALRKVHKIKPPEE